MKIRSLCLFLIIYLNFGIYLNCGIAQNIEFSAGANINRFYDLKEEQSNNSFTSDYSTGIGYSAIFSLNDVQSSSLNFRFTLKLEHYSGLIYNNDKRSFRTINTDVDIEKTNISLGIYPIHFKVLNKLLIDIGAELNFLINHKSSGSVTESINGIPMAAINLNANSLDVNKFFNFGVGSRFSYEISVSENWSINPQYLFFIGATDEFDEILVEAATKSMRHGLLIGFIKTFE